MKLASFVLLSMFAQSLSAETLMGKVHSVDQQFNFLRLDNGRVVFLDDKKVDVESGSNVKVQVSADNSLQEIETLPPDIDEGGNFKSLNWEYTPPPYEPTVFASYSEVEKMFDRLNPNYKRVSECSDRAHVWAYDEFKNHGIKSMKVFAFFTASYINRNRFKWWFHVAPMVYVKEGNQQEGYVLDYRYKDKPVRVKEWTDMMVFSKRTCKPTRRWSEYDVNPQIEDCYIMYDSMYYRLPADLYRQETHNQYRSKFIESEVNTSRRLGFEAASLGGV